MDVNLTELEYNLAVAVARLRNKKPESSNLRFSRHSDLKIHILGLLGEFAFAKATGLTPDITYSLTGDSGYDFSVKGNKIEVKSRLGLTSDLLIRPKNVFPEYTYVLATVDRQDFRKVRLTGWIKGSNILLTKVKQVRTGSRYIINQKDLKKMAPMITRIRELI